MRSRHQRESGRFEVIAGKVIRADGAQHRFALVRNGQLSAPEAFRRALAAADVSANTPSTVLCDGDAALWRLRRKVRLNAAVVLDWWHAAVRFEHALQAARRLGVGTGDTRLADMAVRGLERAKRRLWNGCWPGCRRKLAALHRWAERKTVRGMAGICRLERHVGELLGYLDRNPGGARARRRPASAG